jgi:hypothetical protein
MTIRATAVAMLISCLALGACASLPSQAPITGIDRIAGRWQGDVNFGRFGEPSYLTINPDGTLTFTWGSNWAWGSTRVDGGQANFEMDPPPLQGTFTLLEGQGQRVLVMNDRWARFQAFLRPVL